MKHINIFRSRIQISILSVMKSEGRILGIIYISPLINFPSAAPREIIYDHRPPPVFHSTQKQNNGEEQVNWN